MLQIVYHSQSGSCARLASEALAGARQEEGFESTLTRAVDASIVDLLESSGLLFVTAENSGSLAGGMKDFFDRIFYPAIRQSIVLPYALLVSAGNDGAGAVRQAERILSGIPLKVAMEPLVLKGEVNESTCCKAKDFGLAMAAGLHMGIY